MDPAHRYQGPPEVDQDADVIHFPNRDDEQVAEESSKIYRDEGAWRYHRSNAHGHDRNCTGHVTYIGGGEGERLRGVLAPVIRELLTWAVAHKNAAADSPEERDDRGTA